MPGQDRLYLMEGSDHRIRYAFTLTAVLEEWDVDALTPAQREYLDTHLHEIRESCQAQLRGLLIEAVKSC